MDQQEFTMREQQQQEAMDADAALLEMKQATQRLDEILQHMCVATSSSPPDAELIDSEDAFADAHEHASDQAASVSFRASDDVAGVQHRPREEYASAKDYFSEIETALATAMDLKTAIHVSDQSMHVEDDCNKPEMQEGLRHQQELFTRIARHMTFSITSANPSDWVAERNTPERVAVPFYAELEVHMPYDHFVTRLREQLAAQDQLLPTAKVDAIVDQVIRAIVAQNTTTVNAIRLHFQESGIKDNQNDELHWQQANNQVAQICMRESQCAFQWGLQVVVRIDSLFRVQTKQQRQIDDSIEGPVVSTTLQHCLFLPKSKYSALADNNHDNSVSSTTSVYLMQQQQRQTTSQSETPKSSSTETDTDEPRTISKSSSSASQADSSFAGYTHEFPTRELPELLKIYIRGGFSDEVPSATSSPNQQHQEFVRLTIQTPFPRIRITQAACSRFHALLLSDLGMVFAFGFSVDGALGLGVDGMRRAITAPRLLTFFFDKLITIRAIACGGDPMAGAHSAAVTSDGSMYTWGTGVALGNRSAVSHSEPQLIELPDIEEPGSEIPQSPKAPVIQSIACGAGFCVALSETGHAFVWGKWGDGRLGLGKIPILNQSSRRHGRRRQFQSFQLSPRLLTSDSSHSEAWRFAKVSCGEAHCIALMLNGELLTWGRGTHGQLGLGSARDALAPTKVMISSERHLKWRDVAAGENWSMALDEYGRVWTWGACGGAVLGLGATGASGVRKTAVVTEMILQRHFRLLKQQQSTATVTAPLLPQLSWMRPQLVPCFGNGGVKICRLGAGCHHAAAISSDGDLYLWGDGHGFSALPSLIRSSGAGSEPGMGSEIVEHVVCGGDLVVVFTSGSFLARSMRTLHRQCALLSAEHQEMDRSALYQVTAHLGTDIVLLVSGKRLFAHKLLLARRSAVLRDLILSEQRGSVSPPQAQKRHGDGEDTSTMIMELLLPQLRVDVAQVLLEFVYTDNFSLMLDPQSYLVRDVLRASQLYQLPSLEKLCREALKEASSLSGASATAVLPLDGLDSGFAQYQQDEERSLNTDLQFAFGDRTWSDLTLVAEGDREIPVHRCVLVARSEYFRALLGFQLKQNSFSDNEKVIQVDESYAGMLRVLNFIYNDHVVLPAAHKATKTHDGNQPNDIEPGDDVAEEQLLEDLIAADKYGLVRWKRLCEHAVVADLANCLEVLAVADLVSAAHLKQVALAFLQSNLHVVTAEPAFARLKDDFPHLLEELFTNIRLETTNEALLRNWHEAVEAHINAQRAQEEREWKANSESALKFPWLYLILSITFATLYLAVMTKQVHEYPFVPALNLVALFGFIGALFFGWI